MSRLINLSLTHTKRFLALALLATGALVPAVDAVPVTITYDFLFDQDPVRPGEVPVTGSVTVTLEPPAPSFIGYTSSGVVDALNFSVNGLPGLVPASTNYVKMLFNAGKLMYLLVSDRSDFALSAIPPRKDGYILGIFGTDLLTGTGIQVGSSASTKFSYYLMGRGNVDIAYTFSAANVKKVANPVPVVPTVPDTAGTFGLAGFALLGLVALRRRVRA